MSYTLDLARSIFQGNHVVDSVLETITSFNQLGAEDQLALLWFAYTEMGVEITPAAMQVVNMTFAEKLLTEIKQMPPLQQTQVMCDLVNHTDTTFCRTYSSFGTNTKLGFWYQLSEWMVDRIVAPIPEGYKLSAKASELLKKIDKLEGGQQLTVLQEIVVNMGFSTTGGTSKVNDPIVPPTEPAPRTHVKIKGIDNPTILNYIDALNAFDFLEVVNLFEVEGALKPPFQEPIVGHENILAYLRNECYGLKLFPESGISEPADNGFTQVRVTGKVQTPWFGNSVGINLAWRFLLNPEAQIFFVGIDILASPQKLVELGLVQEVIPPILESV
jgi:Orange carotenoid protein, N-terminal/Nuclear transport factor 2 (NTF2) domain